jgi:hypothetical protein
MKSHRKHARNCRKFRFRHNRRLQTISNQRSKLSFPKSEQIKDSNSTNKSNKATTLPKI